jgi:hypothetical protein
MLGEVETRGSRFWRAAYKVLYRILALIDPVVRRAWRHAGIGNVVEIEVMARDGGTRRRRLIGLLHSGGQTYVGHPNGDVGWTRDLTYAGTAVIRYHDGTIWPAMAHRLPSGAERESAIRATSQHPFPGNLVYRLGRGHIRAVGVFFRLASAGS